MTVRAGVAFRRTLADGRAFCYSALHPRRFSATPHLARKRPFQCPSDLSDSRPIRPTCVTCRLRIAGRGARPQLAGAPTRL